MINYEYLAINLVHPSSDELSQYGAKGWELTTIVKYGTVNTFYFKRTRCQT